MKIKLGLGKTEMKTKREGRKATNPKESSNKQIEKKKVEAPVVEKVNTCKTEPFFLKKTVNESLTIILVEYTEENIKEEILKIIKKSVHSDNICIVRYGNTVDIERIRENSDFNIEYLLSKERQISDIVCFFDAIKILEDIVEIYNHKAYEENSLEKKIIQSIEVIGIGSGKDNGSKVGIEQAAMSLNKINEKKIETKFFCLKETYLKNVAALGFRSIGIFHKVIM